MPIFIRFPPKLVYTAITEQSENVRQIPVNPEKKLSKRSLCIVHYEILVSMGDHNHTKKESSEVTYSI